MKRPIEWHEEGLKNMKRSLQDEKARLDRMIAYFKKSERNIFILEKQIERAKIEGKDRFDPDRYLWNRGPIKTLAGKQD